ncbi:MAG: tetratricopeptide repeat protein [Candidatus Eisenbacteria bacterium]|nr:tetratricopeptide repeat protein [Candidatus Eisenbacteria bacterium]
MPMRDPAGRRLAAILLALAALVALLHALGAGPLRATLWGAHFYGFLPAWALPAGLALLAAGAALALSGALDRAIALLPDPGGWSAPRRAAGATLLAAGSGTLFWLLRVRHTFLGDGNPLSANLARGERFHPHEPLTVLLHHQVYVLARGLFAAPGREPAEVAWDTVALGSVVAGALFVLVAWLLAAELVRAGRASQPASGRAGPAGGAREGRAPTALAFLVLLAQGYVLLFFGYVENYTFQALAVALYLLVALRFLRGAAPLLAPAGVLVLGVCLDLSSVILAPSLLVLAAHGFVRHRAGATLRDLALGAALAAGAGAALAALGGGYSLPGTLRDMLQLAARGHGAQAFEPGYLLSWIHLRDFANEQLLIGPLAALLFVPAALAAAPALARRAAADGRPATTSTAGTTGTGAGRRAEPVDARTAAEPAAEPAAATSAARWTAVFFAAAALAALGAAWLTGDLNLGYPRDWDLFAPFAIVYTAAGLWVLLASVERATVAARLLALALAVSLFHTVPWVAVNASFTRSFARLQVLPLGLGRAEVEVGYWYMTHGDVAEAKRWMGRALEANPANNAAHYSLGLMALEERRYDDATRSLWTALRLRPDKDEYRLRLADALVRSGRPQWARPELDTLTVRTPGDARVWGALGFVRLVLGDGPGAREAPARAGARAPGEPAYRDALATLAAGDTLAAARALREGWDRIVRAP